MGNFTPTAEQQLVAKAIERSYPRNVAIDACAGSGKSSTMRWLISDHVQEKHSVLVCAFNSSTAREMGQFIKTLTRKNVYCKTFNGMGYAILQTVLKRQLGVDRIQFKGLGDGEPNKYRMLCESYVNQVYDQINVMVAREDMRSDEEREEAIDLLESLVQMWRVNTTFPKAGEYELVVLLGQTDKGFPDYKPHDPHNMTTVTRLAHRYGLYGLEHEEDEETLYQGLAKILDAGEQLACDPNELWIDFTDQIYLPVKWGYNKVHQWQANKTIFNSFWVMVDEAQDISPFERAIVDMHIWRDIETQKGRVFIVGDPQQAIYGFKGADQHGFENSLRFWSSDRAHSLSMSWRSPKSAVPHAQKVKPSFKVPDTAIDGEIIELTYEQMLGQIQHGHVVISRTRAPMVILALRLIKDGKTVIIVGSSIGKSITRILRRVSKHKGFTYEHLRDYVAAHRQRVIERMEKRRKPAQEIMDFNDTIDAVYNAIDSVEDEVSTFEELLKTIELRFMQPEMKDCIKVMTGHGSKGLEFETVYCLTPDKFPFAYPGQTPEQYQQELNLSYVAQWTRYKKTLYRVVEMPTPNKEKKAGTPLQLALPVPDSEAVQKLKKLISGVQTAIQTADEMDKADDKHQDWKMARNIHQHHLVGLQTLLAIMDRKE